MWNQEHILSQLRPDLIGSEQIRKVTEKVYRSAQDGFCPGCRGAGFHQEEHPHNGSPIGDPEQCRWCGGCGLSPVGKSLMKWDRRFLQLADHISLWSKDPSTKCGAVLVRPDRSIASMGFNGFPIGCDDRPERYEDREVKNGNVAHAEMNALLFCRDPIPLTGYTLYTSAPVCRNCSVYVRQSRVSRVVYWQTDEERARRWGICWHNDPELVRDRESQIDVICLPR